MAEADVELEEERNEEINEETSLGVFYPATEMHDESASVIRPLLRHDSRRENHSADLQTGTDGADGETAVPQELERAGGDEPRCGGSVRSLCGDRSRHECPICSELFRSQGDHSLVLLNCNHALCHRCTGAILKRAKDPTRLQCPFCRQTTPCPQWEIRRLQEELYGSSIFDPGPSGLAVASGPDVEGVATSLSCCFALESQLAVNGHTDVPGCSPSCAVRGHALCFSISALLLLLGTVLLGILYMLLPALVLFVLDGGNL